MNDHSPPALSSSYIADIKTILANARHNAYRAIHGEMVSAYWQIGERIVHEEQQGQDRAQYGKEIIKTLSAELTREFGKGFGDKHLREMRRFYLLFQDIEIWKTLFSKLTWSHFQRVLKVQNEQARHEHHSAITANTFTINRRILIPSPACGGGLGWGCSLQ